MNFCTSFDLGGVFTVGAAIKSTRELSKFLVHQVFDGCQNLSCIYSISQNSEVSISTLSSFDPYVEIFLNLPSSTSFNSSTSSTFGGSEDSSVVARENEATKVRAQRPVKSIRGTGSSN